EAVRREHRKAGQHWGLLRRTPYALADALLVLVSLLAFLGVAALLTHLLGDNGRRAYPYVLVVISAYAGVRVALAVARLLASPAGQSMRLLTMSDAGARYVFK